jgi:hypothetical protein
MKRDGRVRIFSVTRLFLSVLLGFLLLVSYVVMLFLIDLAGKTPPAVVLSVIGWPRWFWMRLGGSFSDDDMISGFTFFAICDTALYAAITYPLLLALSFVRRKRAVPDPPPPPKPEQFHSGQAASD